jgi:hypothetical protein
LDAQLRRLSEETLFWYCETRPRGPLYVLPTRELVAGLARAILGLAGPRATVLEVAAGDGFLTRSLRRAAPNLGWTATDSGAWEDAQARLSRAERRHLPAIAGLGLGPGVEKLDAVAAIRRYRPDVVIAAWLPPGTLFDHIVRAPCRYVLEIGAAGGVAGPGEWGWRFAHDFLPETLERLARSRLDAGTTRRTRLTLYFGRLHPDYREERPRSGDWLAQFKPQKRRGTPRQPARSRG